MTTTDKWQIAAFIWGAVAQTLFLFTYSKMAWWRSYVGRALWSKSGSLWLLLMAPLANVWLDYRYEEVVEAVIFWLVAFAATYQWAAMKRKRKEVAQTVQQMEKPTEQPPPEFCKMACLDPGSELTCERCLKKYEAEQGTE